MNNNISKINIVFHLQKTFITFADGRVIERDLVNADEYKLYLVEQLNYYTAADLKKINEPFTYNGQDYDSVAYMAK